MTLTIAVIIATVVLLSIYDAWTIARRGSDTTISVVIWRLSQKYPIIPFAFGVLMGHFFAQLAGT